MMTKQYFHLSAFVLILTLIAAIVYQGWQPGSIENKQIRINGVFVLVNQDELLERVRELSNVNQDRNDFLNRVEQLLVQEPYILSASVRYAWPNHVVIDITEITPKAMLTGYGFLTQDCRIAEYTEAQQVAGLPVFELENVKFDQSSCEQILKIYPYLNEHIRLVTLLSNGNYRLHTAMAQYIIGNDLDRVFGMISRIEKAMANAADESLIIDLRYASGAAIRRLAKL